MINGKKGKEGYQDEGFTDFEIVEDETAVGEIIQIEDKD